MTNLDITNLWRYDLRKGNTDHPRNGACLFDAGMWLVYGKIGDNPPCSCPVIRAYAIGLNDHMPDDVRQRLLKPFILRVVGNRDPQAERARLHYIVLETARRVVPLVLGRRWPEHANRLRSLPDDASYDLIRLTADAVARAAADARAAAAAADAAATTASATAATTASAATTATAEDQIKAWETAASILDGALLIGKQAPEFNEDEVRSSIAAFDRARLELA